MAETFYTSGTLNGGRTGLTGTPAWEEDFTLDPTGNWGNYTTKVSGSTTLNQGRTFNAVNEIETIAGASTYIAQNAAGNITLAPKPSSWSSAYTLIYDAWNRLAQVKSGATVVITYAYDGQNWRTTKAYGGYVWDYYYTSAWQVIEEERTADDTTYPWLQNVWGLLGPDNLVLRDRPDERLYAFSNSLGSISAIVNASGTVQERYGYNAFGTPLFMNVEWFVTGYSSFDWVTLFAGYLYDVEDQFYQARNRFLHPALGRWLSRDPIGYDGGLNLYAYVGNAPTNQVDPMGLADVDYSGYLKFSKVMNPYGPLQAINVSWDLSPSCSNCTEAKLAQIEADYPDDPAGTVNPWAFDLKDSLQYPYYAYQTYGVSAHGSLIGQMNDEPSSFGTSYVDFIIPEVTYGGLQKFETCLICTKGPLAKQILGCTTWSMLSAVIKGVKTTTVGGPYGGVYSAMPPSSIFTSLYSKYK